jgi:hypothetical protein
MNHKKPPLTMHRLCRGNDRLILMAYLTSQTLIILGGIALLIYISH